MYVIFGSNVLLNKKTPPWARSVGTPPHGKENSGTCPAVINKDNWYSAGQNDMPSEMEFTIEAAGDQVCATRTDPVSTGWDYTYSRADGYSYKQKGGWDFQLKFHCGGKLCTIGDSKGELSQYSWGQLQYMNSRVCATCEDVQN